MPDMDRRINASSVFFLLDGNWEIQERIFNWVRSRLWAVTGKLQTCPRGQLTATQNCVKQSLLNKTSSSSLTSLFYLFNSQLFSFSKLLFSHLKLSTNHFIALLYLDSSFASSLSPSGVMTDIEVPVTRPARVTLVCLCNQTLQAEESVAPQVVGPRVYAHGCHWTTVHYERAVDHIKFFQSFHSCRQESKYWFYSTKQYFVIRCKLMVLHVTIQEQWPISVADIRKPHSKSNWNYIHYKDITFLNSMSYICQARNSTFKKNM